jgi:hypothetical protein
VRRIILPDIYAHPWRYSFKHFVLAAVLFMVWRMFVIGSPQSALYAGKDVAELIVTLVVATVLTALPATAFAICSFTGLIVGTFHIREPHMSNPAHAD